MGIENISFLPNSFIAISLIHLIACFKENKWVMNLSKPFLLIFLLLSYITTANTINNTLLSAIVFSWLGDVLLMFKAKFLVLSGVWSFSISHIFYSFSIVSHISEFNQIIISTLFILYTVFYTFVPYDSIGERFGDIKLIGFGYGINLMYTNMLSLYLWYSNPSEFTLIIFLGASSFCISDYILVKGLFINKIKNFDFVVMLSYIWAEGLLVYGLYQLDTFHSI